MPREFADPYTYPGTGVLRNKPGLRDEEALEQFEYEQSKFRAGELLRDPIPGQFDLAHLKAIHAHVFQDVYEWAGQLRTVNISKGGTTFAQPAFIESEGKRMSAALAAEKHLQGLGKPKFVERLAHHYADWNALHPFREGNGRATREFLAQLARGAGYELDQTNIDNSKDQWNQAAKRSFAGDLEPIKAIFNEAVRYSRAVAFEKLPQAEALAKHLELKGAFDSLRVMQHLLDERFPGNELAQGRYAAQARSEALRRLDSGQLIASPRELPKAQEEQAGYQVGGRSGGIDR